VRKIAEDRGRKSRAGSGHPPSATSPLEKLREAERRARAASQTEPDSGDGIPHKSAGAPTQAEVADLLKESGDIIAAREAELADETVILRLLATLGLTAAEFSHETGMTFEAVRISFRRVFKVARSAKPDDSTFQEDVDRAD